MSPLLCFSLVYSSVLVRYFFLLFEACGYIVQHNQASTIECIYQLYDDKPHGLDELQEYMHVVLNIQPSILL